MGDRRNPSALDAGYVRPPCVVSYTSLLLACSTIGLEKLATSVFGIQIFRNLKSVYKNVHKNKKNAREFVEYLHI